MVLIRSDLVKLTEKLSLLQNLSNNQLRLEGADIISKMLLDNYYIKSLKLSGDQLRLFLYAALHIMLIKWKRRGLVI